MTIQTPRGIRNNNPGNIRWGDDWKGLVPKDQRTDKSFCQFTTPEYGIRAMIIILRNYQRKYGLDTVKLLPDELVTVQTIVAPDKKAIKEAIEAAEAAAAQITADGGEVPAELLNPVPGAHLEIGERSLQVR